MTEYEPMPPANLSVLFTAGVVEAVLNNRDERDYPRKLLRAGQMLLQSLYASDLLICCVDQEPVAVAGVHGPMMVAASDREAADAYLAAAVPSDANVSFRLASELSEGATNSGRWKSKRDAWRGLFNRAGGTYMLLNPAGPGTARILGVALDDGKPARFSSLAMPSADEFPQPHERAAGRELTEAAVAELAG
jgi:hypothetical protein